MKEPILIILAAGLGTRYGELKNIEAFNDESIIDFSIYDAIEAGFKRMILIIRREHEDAFEKHLVKKIRPFIDVDFAYQDMQDIPKNFTVPEERVKPWGTAHALLACRNLVDAPFVVINADDYYGKEAFKIMYRYLSVQVADYQFCMVGYALNNTLTDYGTVNRGICSIREGDLMDITEKRRIKRIDGFPQYTEDDKTWYALDPNSIVSMNFWGFTPKIMELLMPLFERFLAEELEKNPLKCELVLSYAIGELIRNRRISVKVLRSSDRWYGVNYREDREHFLMAVAGMKARNMYPQDLWAQD